MTAEIAQTDVLVIGDGPVGLTLTNGLRKRGVDVRIVEKLPAIREISRPSSGTFARRKHSTKSGSRSAV